MSNHKSSKSDMELSRRNFLRAGLVFTAGLGIAGYTYANGFEPSNLTVSNISVSIKNLPDSFQGYRIVQFSDIHAGTWMNHDRLMRVVELVNAQMPDLIAITGDFVTRGDVVKLFDMLIKPLSKLKAPDGVLGVLGNHDYWVKTGDVREVLKTSNIHELNNKSIVLERDGDKLAIGGVDDVSARKSDLDRVIQSLPEATVPAILLAHEPDFADASAESGRFALQISGHSHGGQVRIPGIGAPYLPSLGRKYPLGRYQVRDMVQYTNRGVGMSPPNFRFACPPEITVYTLATA